ncbi:MAG: exodeoxyribonuclease V subunit gamma, partial [Burkholderiaceae bacterium]
AQRMGWRLHGLLKENDWVQDHPRLARYLQACDALMRHDLGMQLGGRFEQYTTYRPDWLAAWEKGQLTLQSAIHAPSVQEDERWQAALWRRLQEQIGATGFDPVGRFIEILSGTSPEAWQALGQPAQVQLVALSGMPPQHARMLAALGEVMDVHVHVINPCQEYWFDLVDARRLSHLARKAKVDGFEVGHPLLAAWGKQTQSQLGVLIDAFADRFDDEGTYRPNPDRSLLAALQNSILELSPVEPGSLPPAQGDSSIEIHACHSLSRQLEVLHSRLLSAFAERDSTLAPGDVLVVMPDLTAAAPLIEAIFGTVPVERRIPFRISGLATPQANPVARALQDLLGFVTGRAGVTGLLDLLAQAPIARRLRLSPAEHETLAEWLAQAGAHWGLDARHRAAFGGADLARHTLIDALDALFASYALPLNSPHDALGRWPVTDIQGSDSLALGKLWRFGQSLIELAARLATPLTAAQWQQLLSDLLARFIEVPARDIEDLQATRSTLTRLFDEMSGIDPGEPIEAGILNRALQAAFEEAARGGVPSGEVTFSAPASLRHLPFRIVAFLGLDDNAFPAQSRAQEFDLMARAPRMGDRQRREDDRNLMLDLLLCARERLLLGYTAFSIRDNASLPPSVLLAELIETLERGCPDNVRKALHVAHPLQAFDRSAFFPQSDPRIRSHDPQIAQAWRQALPLRARGQASDGPPRFFNEAKSPLVNETGSTLMQGGIQTHTHLTLDALIRILCDPSSALLQEQTHLRFERDPEPLQDEEPLTADRRALRQLERQAAFALLQGHPLEPLIQRKQLAPELPGGWLGEQPVRERVACAQAYVERVRLALQHSAHLAIPFELVLDTAESATGSLILTGQLGTDRSADNNASHGHRGHVSQGLAQSGLNEHGLFLGLGDPPLERALLSAWVHHLVLCALRPQNIKTETQAHTFDKHLVFRSVDAPLQCLSELAALALKAKRSPLAFFPRSSLALAQGDPGKAHEAWMPRRRGAWGESDRPEIQLVWRGLESPIDTDAFDLLAHQIFGPLLEHCELNHA